MLSNSVTVMFDLCFSFRIHFQITCILLTVSIGHILITEVSVRMWAAANIEEFSALRTKKHGQTCTTDMYFTFLKGMISEC